jgi:two-component system chemotaxis sensor kinase CheA
MRTRQLQEGVMAVRMQPLKALFQRFPRIVRDLSRKLGKSVRLELDGEATEVDKTIIEELSDPLTHMIRNCMDHGLETPEERQAAGKPEQGVVRLSAEHRNGRILIRVSDDGRGLNPEKVFNKAVENGLIDADAELSKEEIEALIFMPGFSTAAEISDVSGRGVGMDVVRRNIQKLGGRVTVESNEGEGSTFTLALPLTLAVLDGMLVSVAGERYVVPLSAIVETVCPDASAIRALPDGGTVMPLRGEAIRLIDLCQSMNLSRLGQAEPLRKLAVIVETEFGRRIGLVVDELLGQQQVVIKSLEANYRRIEGVAGTAILGDGRVRLILDIDGLAAMAGRNPDASPMGGETANPEEATGGLSA